MGVAGRSASEESEAARRQLLRGRREGLDCAGYRLRTPKQRRFDAVFFIKKKIN